MEKIKVEEVENEANIEAGEQVYCAFDTRHVNDTIQYTENRFTRTTFSNMWTLLYSIRDAQ